jgi:hypothetical protein
MDARKWSILSTVAVVSLMLATGCMTGDNSRTTNQGGGTLISAGLKYGQNNLGALNPDEIQIVTDYLIAQNDLPIPPLTDEQAAAVVQFMADNNLSTREDILALQDANPDDIVISPSVRDVLASDEVQQIVQSLTGVDLSGVL